MNALAQTPLVTPRWRLGVWAARAWGRMGWRHVLLALLIQFVRDAIHPLGGIFFPPSAPAGWDPVLPYLGGNWLVTGIPTVYCVLVADEAFEDGVPPLRAYGLAVIAMVGIVPLAARLFPVLTRLLRSPGQPEPGIDEGVAQFV